MVGAIARAVLILIVLLLATHTAGAAEICARPDIEGAAQQLRDARHALHAVPIPSDLAKQTDVPAEAQSAIAAMKARLAGLTNAYMRCAPGDISTKQLGGELLALARGGDADPTDDDSYGGRIDFDVRLTAGAPQLIGIVAKFSIHCGEDAALFIFSRHDDTWREALRWHSKDYPTVGGAFWSFDYAISPPDRTGGWFVVTKNVAPWCSSTWSNIRYSVLRPRSDAAEAVELLRGEDGMWWGGEDFGQLSIRRDEFELRFHGSAANPEKHNQPYLRRFRVSGSSVSPLAIVGGRRDAVWSTPPTR